MKTNMTVLRVDTPLTPAHVEFFYFAWCLDGTI